MFHSLTAKRFIGLVPAMKMYRPVVRKCSTTAKADPLPPSDSQTHSFFGHLAFLYGTYLGANFLSNHLNHPFQKLDYGIMNRIFMDDRPIDSPFWSTRLPHLLLLPVSLTFYDVVCGKVSARVLGLTSFKATPAAWLINLYVYTFLAVGSFFAFDASLNPDLEGKRMDSFLENYWKLPVAMGLQWHAEMLHGIIIGAAAGTSKFLRGIVSNGLVFCTVKGMGFGDYGEGCLSPHERKMNGLADITKKTDGPVN